MANATRTLLNTDTVNATEKWMLENAILYTTEGLDINVNALAWAAANREGVNQTISELREVAQRIDQMWDGVRF